MKLTLNGEAHETDAKTVRDLIAELGLTRQAVAVEVNQRVVPRKQHDQARLRDGDEIELVTLVGGG